MIRLTLAARRVLYLSRPVFCNATVSVKSYRPIGGSQRRRRDGRTLLPRPPRWRCIRSIAIGRLVASRDPHFFFPPSFFITREITLTRVCGTFTSRPVDSYALLLLPLLVCVNKGFFLLSLYHQSWRVKHL